ncbi:MAG: sigma-54-dependent Fis family transcriptional regulator [Acidobacteriaceae bacterium]|nr:sigma-54-dependent Fis family transcriptional regulator [Acidobacteriaceae bacterium]MBV9296523.1 sigma-54-dependent Fis family transcriptional regulator [Acidobacteriaceae bacterium]
MDENSGRETSSAFEGIVGVSEPLASALRDVSLVAPTNSTVLITGETGAGKELIAQAIHKRSQRANRPFITVNCAAIPQPLITSELFGHEKGAFTGATERRVGRFEAANGGTIFLDEIGDVPSETQVALLRVLQEREFERLGSSRPIPSDVRVVAATNCDLETAVETRTFRADLFYRLNVFPIRVPALRERPDDIPVLAKSFMTQYAAAAGKTIRTIDKKSLQLLQAYHWPGNVRELQNVIERAVILCKSDTLIVDERWTLGGRSHIHAMTGSNVVPLNRALLDREKQIIEAALEESSGRISGPRGAATRLEIPRSTLESRIQSLGIDKYSFKCETRAQNGNGCGASVRAIVMSISSGRRHHTFGNETASGG